MRIGLVSDLHGVLPAEVFDLLHGVERLLVAGDTGRSELLADLEAIAPVLAVWGNVDGPEIRAAVPESRETDLGGARFALVHGHRAAPHYVDLLDAFPTADVVVHGHTHVPRCERIGSRLLVNPGAASAGRGGWPPSLAIAEVVDGRVEVRHLRLPDGAPLVPRR
ncbi:MAG: metallophosphoesterase family protein [Gemmatimonadota bacterium]|nr:metallophosphoesterase family protein [Gemmatimonadota bacterium]